MDSRPQIKVTADPTTGRFALQPLSHNGQASTGYVPDLMKSPDKLIYVFDRPEVLSSLVQGLSVTNTSGRRVATGTLALMKNLRLSVLEPCESSQDGQQNEEQKQQQAGVVQQWKGVLQRLPSGHRVNEVQLDMRSQERYGIQEKDVDGFVEPLSSVLSGKPNGGVKCVLIR